MKHDEETNAQYCKIKSRVNLNAEHEFPVALIAHANVIEHLRAQICCLWCSTYGLLANLCLQLHQLGRTSGKLSCCCGEPCPVWAAGQYFGCRVCFPRLSPKRQFPE
eukprot:TRINITY_DN32808_c0_g1_i1.p1 TRINITY_DN32808_c0_g1~~TRINITY_DN32808_c0_g1_i1.p1  ORF type:complete len:107 (-),score=8.70 TRINITY_DN32808_c0_g1_i1:568-888(-)